MIGSFRDAAAEAEANWRTHVETGEPLDADEVRAVVAAGLTADDEWEDRGGGLYWHRLTWPEPANT